MCHRNNIGYIELNKHCKFRFGTHEGKMKFWVIFTKENFCIISGIKNDFSIVNILSSDIYFLG